MANHLDPESSPDILTSAKNHTHGVKKLNKLPLLLLFLIVIIVVGVIIFTIADRGNKKASVEAEDTTIAGEATDPSKMIDSLINSLEKKEEKKEVKKENKRETTPLMKSSETPPKEKIQKEKPLKTELPMGMSEEEKRLRKMRLDMLHDAILSKTKVSGASRRNSGGASSGSLTPGVDGLPAGIGTSLNLVKDMMGKALNKPKEEVDIRNKNEMFIDAAKKSYRYTEHTKTPLVSPYEIKTGTVIPGILITGMNSELPGQILGQVSENVYDTATGNFMLIPQGTKIIGEYSSGVEYGQSRLLVVWNRLIFPDGKTLNIGAMIGTDKQGYSGFDDEVDNHYFRIFGSAFLLSIIGGDIMIKDGKLTFASGTAKSTTQDTTRKESILEKTASKMIEKNMNLAPTITVRPGYKFNIFVNQDMILEPLAY